MAFWVYMLRCADGSYYTGHTDALEQRIAQHHAGAVRSCYTFDLRPLTLVFSQECATREEALASEMRIKRWSRAKKEALIHSDWDALRGLAKRRTAREHTDAAGGGGSIAGVSIDRDAVASTFAPHHQRVAEAVEKGGSEARDRAMPNPIGTEQASPQSVRDEEHRGSEIHLAVRGEEASRRPAGTIERPSRTMPAEAVTPATFSAADLHWMHHALTLADRAERDFDEVPVGAVLVDAAGNLLAEGCNRTIGQHDPTAHAEIVALRAAGEKLANYRLTGTTLYVTLEPCAMCAMALVHARVARVVYAARDPKTGAAGSVFDLLGSERHNHRIRIDAGLLGDEAGARLTRYFRRKRGKPD